jgi:pyrroline-5-carboxylate reductase
MTTPDPAGPIALIGGGNMTDALLAGLRRPGRDGATPCPDGSRFLVVEPVEERAERLRREYGVTVTDIEDAVRRARIVFFVLKPYLMEPVVSSVAPLLSKDHLVVSLAGGVTLGQIERFATPPDGSGVPALRCVPNIAASVGSATIAVASGQYAGPEHVDWFSTLLAPLGLVVPVPERQLNIFTAISGSSLAYYYYVVEAMIDAGVLLGLDYELSTKVAVQSLAGAGDLLRHTGADPAKLRAAVSSPGGTTIAAIRLLEDRAVRGAFIAAAEVCRDRAIELGGAS